VASEVTVVESGQGGDLTCTSKSEDAHSVGTGEFGRLKMVIESVGKDGRKTADLV